MSLKYLRDLRRFYDMARTASSACKSPSAFLAAALICSGAALSACSVLPQSSKNNLLIEASGKGQVDEMERLIKDGADINSHNAEGWTPYLAASSNGRLEAMRLLRHLGARTDAPDEDFISAERRSELND